MLIVELINFNREDTKKAQSSQRKVTFLNPKSQINQWASFKGNLLQTPSSRSSGLGLVLLMRCFYTQTFWGNCIMEL